MKIIFGALIALSVLVFGYFLGDVLTAKLGTCVSEGYDCPWSQK